MNSWDTDVQASRRTSSDVTAMRIRQEHQIGAPRHTVWDLLTRRIDDWWTHPYRIMDRDSTMRLDLQPYGSLAEYWSNNGFATWGHVSQLDPETTLELTGPCGMGAVHGVYTFHLQDQDDGVLVSLTHDAFGPIGEDVQHTFEDAWRHMLERLKELAEGKLAYGAEARTI